MPHRLFLTGDTHRQVDVAKLSFQKFPIQKDLDRSDIMVVLGDWAFFGMEMKEIING